MLPMSSLRTPGSPAQTGTSEPAHRLGRVSLHLFDTATREMREFQPLEPGKVGMYICGLTTQGAPHIGHVRFAVAFDVLRHLVSKVDHLIIGGGMANTFLAARGVDVGKSLCEHDLAATAEEIMLIPGAGKRMAHEFDEYRPWKAWAQFDKEIGKYVDAKEVARLAQYAFIPLNLNTATDAEILTIPGAGNRMLREFKEYRPYKAMEQFRKELGKSVPAKAPAPWPWPPCGPPTSPRGSSGRSRER